VNGTASNRGAPRALLWSAVGASAIVAACGSGGAEAAAPPVPYYLGADITWVQQDETLGASYLDTDGVPKDILELLKSHGFNSVRLRTFVDPRAADGYDRVAGFGDAEHTVAMARRIKQAGMSFLLTLHYSDNWADPGKQCIPVAWQGGTFSELTQHVHDYTLELLQSLKNAGGTPDMVQVGNEITWGMLFDICDSDGIPTGDRPEVNGHISDWAKLGTLLRAGIEAVQEVDPAIGIVLHTDKGGDLGFCTDWLRGAQAQALPFDVFAGTTYTPYQGQPSAWQDNFTTLASNFPDLSFIIPEYSNEAAESPPLDSTIRITNDIMFNLPNQRGLGTWFYEPAHPFVGSGLFESGLTDDGVVSDQRYRAIPAAIAEYDQMKAAYAVRLR